MPQWFDDDAFWSAFYPYMFSKSRLAAAPDEVGDIFALTGVADGDVLDLCCGPGRHTTALAEAGMRVTGVDASRFLLDKARALANELGLAVEWVQEDMRSFLRPGSFDLALNLFTSFGFFANPNDDLVTLRNVCHSLRSGGVFVIDILGKEVLAQRFQATSSERIDEKTLMVQRHEIIDSWSAIRNEWTLINNGVARFFEFQLRLYSGIELRDLLYRAGFTSVNLYGDFKGSPYGLDAQRLVAIAVKE